MSYEGWSNYETWLFWTHIQNDGWMYDQTNKIAAESFDEDVTKDDVADIIEGFMSDEVYKRVREGFPIIVDMVGHFFVKVDWREILDAIIENQEYAKAHAEVFGPTETNLKS